MSMHKIPLTPIEESGLRAHGLDIGKPSQLSDAFRQGVRYAHAQLPSQEAKAAPAEPVSREAVEVVGVRISSDGFGSYIADSAMGTGPLYPGDVREPLMTVAQHKRLMANHSADDLNMVKVPRELLERIDIYLEANYESRPLLQELRALLDNNGG